MASRNKTLSILNQFKDTFAKRYGITALGIFGSIARDEDNEDSDVDIVVKMTKPDLFYLVHIKDELQEAYKRPVDIVRYREKMNPFLKKRIDGEAIYV
ncbi:MAG: nucleotidyltransferase [Proteobacteria bacterium]|nr:nucleotidyltransferase [Pseudomonadota bacterium]